MNLRTPLILWFFLLRNVNHWWFELLVKPAPTVSSKKSRSKFLKSFNRCEIKIPYYFFIITMILNPFWIMKCSLLHLTVVDQLWIRFLIRVPCYLIISRILNWWIAKLVSHSFFCTHLFSWKKKLGLVIIIWIDISFSKKNFWPSLFQPIELPTFPIWIGLYFILSVNTIVLFLSFQQMV
jgi:hypothetical protein